MEKNGSTGSPHRRSVGVKVFATIITASAGFYSYVFLEGFEGIFASFGIGLNSYFSGVFLVAVLILTVSGIGLFFFKKWARLATIFGASLLLLHLLFVIFASLTAIKEGFSIVVTLFEWWIVLHGADIIAPFVLYFFTRPKVKEQFK